MFIKSAASYTNQGKAIQSINEKWGEQTSGTRRPWGGRETIGIQVCKKKYSPFLFTVEETDHDENDAKNCNNTGASCAERKRIVKVVRLFGCPHHSDLRKEKIECHGVRKGWEPFGQWSLRKAQQLARGINIKLNLTDSKSSTNKQVEREDRHDLLLSQEGRAKEVCDENCTSCSNIDDEIRTICHNGKCLWKKRDKHDDVYREITGYSESSGEEDT